MGGRDRPQLRPHHFGVEVVDILKSLVPVLPVCIGALLGYFVATGVERHKESRIRYAITTLLQAELIRLYMKLKDHNSLLTAYAHRFSKEVNAQEALKYVPIGMENDFIIYRNCVKEIGLLDTEAAREAVYCYGNVIDFVSAQDTFLRDLPGIANSTMLGHRAQNLCARETAALQQIGRAIPLLAKQSTPLPFTA
jgi:hypothetical protein